MIVGLAILTQWTRLGAYVAMVWLVAIALNLVTTGMFSTWRSGTSRSRSARTPSPG
jgi:hypothetical protein